MAPGVPKSVGSTPGVGAHVWAGCLRCSSVHCAEGQCTGRSWMHAVCVVCTHGLPGQLLHVGGAHLVMLVIVHMGELCPKHFVWHRVYSALPSFVSLSVWILSSPVLPAWWTAVSSSVRLVVLTIDARGGNHAKMLAALVQNLRWTYFSVRPVLAAMSIRSGLTCTHGIETGPCMRIS